MGPNWIRFGDRYCIPQDLIKYFRIETDNNKLIAKLKDGEEISKFLAYSVIRLEAFSSQS